MATLFDGGPVELPCRVNLVDALYECRRVSPVRIASLAAGGRWFELGKTLLADSWNTWNGIDTRLIDTEDPLDVMHVAETAVKLFPAIAGVGTEIIGWRVAMNLCGYMLRSWPDVSGQLIAVGVDPMHDQMWRVMSAVRHSITTGTNPDDQGWVRDLLEAPLPVEPACFAGAGAASPDSIDRQRRAFVEMLE